MKDVTYEVFIARSSITDSVGWLGQTYVCVLDLVLWSEFWDAEYMVVVDHGGYR